MNSGPAQGRTLWEEGRLPGRLVASGATVLTLAVVALDVLGTARIGLFFDVAFVVICVLAALSVRPRDYFMVGVLPPLILLGIVVLMALVATDAVAEPRDGLVQAVVSGLAHHATALVVGYALTLGTLALRQVVGGRNHQRRRTLTDSRHRSAPTG